MMIDKVPNRNLLVGRSTEALEQVSVRRMLVQEILCRLQYVPLEVVSRRV